MYQKTHLIKVLISLVIVTTMPVVVFASTNLYLNEWSVKISGGKKSADSFALANGFVNLGEIIPESGEYHMRYPRRAKRSLQQDPFVLQKILKDKDVESAEQLVEKIRVKRDHPARSVRLNDPYWEKMWYLNRGEDLDMNVEGAWEEGVTGKGVAVTILDDGIERDHPDLIRNYDPMSSFDINDNDDDPRPRYDRTNSNGHGTRCAGQVAASSNNSLCAVGIAYNAKIGGIRMLDGQVSDAVEARSFSFNPDHVDIYSSSWGPNDDGKTVDGPGQLALKAIRDGATKGRGGKGSIFVLASGNGGKHKDNCNCDGYATSIYTISVSSTSESGHIPWYSEACSSTLATTYSSGTTKERQVVTTDLHHSCTAKHTGTSASAPMAAAIIALTLEANPALTWRDVQHIIVRTARPANLQARDWKVNGLGRKVSHSYGFGLMDATAMVRLSKKWTNMPAQRNCTIVSPYYYKMIPAMSSITIELQINDDCPIRALEHVVSPIHVSTGRKRGDFRIYLISPLGTRSTLLDNRPRDYSSSGFVDWPFMTVHPWGEDPRGTWKLEVHNDGSENHGSAAKFYTWSLQLFGTEYDPNSLNESERKEAKSKVVVRNVEQDKKEDEDNVVAVSPSPTASSGSYNYSRGTASSVGTTATIGCISKQGDCVTNTTECRTFSHGSVARIFCKCTPNCSQIVGSSSSFHLQCQLDSKEKREVKEEPSGLPSYCQFFSLHLNSKPFVLNNFDLTVNILL